MLNMAGRSLFAVSTGFSLVQGVNGAIHHDYGATVKSGVDIGVGAVATFGGPVGFGVGTGYFILDMMGAFNSGPPAVITPVPFGVPDATSVR